MTDWTEQARVALAEARRLLLALARPTIPDAADEQEALALVERIERLTRRVPT